MAQQSHRRLPKLRRTKLSELSIDPRQELDELFTKRYKNYLLGKLTISWTRLPVEKITRGFLRRSSRSPVELVSDTLQQEYVDAISLTIRRGRRPTVLVYCSPFQQKEDEFVCSDDQYILEAYRQLGFGYIPCGILSGNRTGLVEAAIQIRLQSNRRFHLHGLVPVHSDGYQSLLVDGVGDISTSISHLMDVTSAAIRDIRSFHEGGQADTHYHHMLCATLHRHRDTLEAIGQQLKAGRYLQAMSLLRMMYEGFLNFYIDWLSPEHIGPMLQLSSQIRRVEVSLGRGGEADEIQLKRMIRDSRALYGPGFSELLQNAAQKASLSPLGTYFHNSVYPWLSFATHSDYGATQSHAGLLDDEAVLPPFQDADERLIKWSDAVTTALIVRILADVGAGIDVDPSPA